MRRFLLQGMLLAASVLAFTPLAWVQNAATPTLSRFVPAGPVVAVEAKDFAALLSAWNGSPEKAAWLASDNYADFSRSKLFLRLREAQGEFASAAGFSIDLEQLESVAGGESVLAIYDIGELRMLYVTELDGAAALETALLRSRLNLETRRSAGVDYWVRTDAESGREIAFAVAQGRLFIATDDTLLGRALELQAGQGGPAFAGEPWYPAPGVSSDLRVIENLSVLVRSPHFRSYWIQGNITELSAYSSAVSDVFFEDGSIREQRRLTRAEPAQAVEASQAAALASLAPDEAELVRAWNRPMPESVVALVSQKLLAPGTEGVRPRYELAPPAPGMAGRAGSSSDLETRIDAPPATVSRTTANLEPLAALLAENPAQALLQAQISSLGAGLARYPSLIGVLGEAPWDEAAALGALQAAVREYWTASGSGAAWQSRGDYYAAVGLRPLFAAVRGNLLLASDSEDLLTATLARQAAADDDLAVYRAVFRHNREAASYARVMAHLDFLDGRNPLQTPRQPSLFADNLGSLSQTLSRIETVEIERFDRGAYVEERLVYGLRP